MVTGVAAIGAATALHHHRQTRTASVR